MPPRRSLQQLALDYAGLQQAWGRVLSNEPIAWTRLVEIHGELLLIERCLRLHHRSLP
jgi:hypothetical protein